MILDLFLPRVIGTYFVIPERIVGLEIGKNAIHATRLYASRSKITIEECIEYSLDANLGTTHLERVQYALREITPKLKPYHKVCLALPSTQLIFKKIKLPFIDRAKIQMVVGYEVEPLLPFGASEAVIDFIVTSINESEKSSEVLVVAARQKYIEEYMHFFEGTSIQPDVLGVDLLALYALYKRMSTYTSIQGAVALVDIKMNETLITYVHEGQLRSIRVLTKGIADIQQTIANSMQLSLAQANEQLMRFGFDSPEQQQFAQTARQAMNPLISDINFTLTSFIAQEQTKQTLEQIIISGDSANIAGLTAILEQSLHAPCKVMHIHELVQETNIALKKNSTIANKCMISLAVALPSPIIDDFNLLQAKSGIVNLKKFYKQAGTTIVLALLCIGSLYAYSFTQKRMMRTALEQSETELAETLKSKFPAIDRKETNLEDILDEAQKQVRAEQRIWFAFSTPSPLKYLLELFTKVDRQATEFVLERFNISEGIMTIKGQVKDHAALQIFERDLRQSKLFSAVESQENPKFTMKITLANPSQEG